MWFACRVYEERCTLKQGASACVCVCVCVCVHVYVCGVHVSSSPLL